MKNAPQENPTSKVCYKCQETKDLSEFNKCKTGVYGFHNHCRECQKKVKKEWYEKNKEKEIKKSSEYSKSEKARLARKKRWNEKKSELGPKNNTRRKTPEARERARIQRQKWLSVPQNRIAHNLRCRIRKAIGRKSDSTIALLGISFDELKIYLENMFEPGMSWDNYGEWHIDHIKPCASFDLNDPKQQEQCFHYTNLQPLWAYDNQSKGCR